MLVTRIGNFSLHALTRDEGLAGEIDAEPIAEFLGVRQRAPYARAWGLQQDLSLDTVCRCGHMQPPGCILAGRPHRCNQKVACATAPWPIHKCRPTANSLILLVGVTGF